MKKIIILLIALCLTACNIQLNNNSNEIQNDVEEEKNIVEEKKTYDLSSDDFKEYINQIMINSKEKTNFKDLNTRKSYPYIKISFSTDKKIKNKTIDDDINLIIKNIYNELIKNNYKSGSFFKYSYEYLNIHFFNYDDKNQKKEIEFFQINLLEINNYDSFESFYKKNTE